MKAVFNKNKMWLGFLLGALIPVVSYFILDTIVELSRDSVSGARLMEESTVEVLSIVANVILFRYYMIKKKHDETGKGMLLATFVFAFIYLIMYL